MLSLCVCREVVRDKTKQSGRADRRRRSNNQPTAAAATLLACEMREEETSGGVVRHIQSVVSLHSRAEL